MHRRCRRYPAVLTPYGDREYLRKYLNNNNYSPSIRSDPTFDRAMSWIAPSGRARYSQGYPQPDVDNTKNRFPLSDLAVPVRIDFDS
jgi:hypothetical protein